ncbi:MAG TPA: DUF222 domain-containing protein [Ilumatobacteraceae bacterium]|nr:DUF222 domain-containing protein [Ilumatobacteraceae bacterium]HRB02481.1 DUF222 domain-containing protein [Ilumatobacteraceae bacterium]
MDATAAHLLVDSIGLLPAESAGLLRVVKDCHRLASWVEAQRLAAVAALAADGSRSPASDVADAAKTSRFEGDRVVQRAQAAGLMPQLAEALSDGKVNTRHLDAAANVLRRAKPEQREKLAQRSHRWGRAATSMSVGEFHRFAEKELRDVQADDGVERFEQQRRDARLKIWKDEATGMVMGRFALDPENGATLMGAVRNMVESMFHDRQPETCPTDPIDRQEHLQALALMALIRGEGASTGRPEVIVVIDYETLVNGMHASSTVRVSDDVEVPVETVRRMGCDGEIIPVVLGGQGEALDVGRAARLATRAQRRALRAMFHSCWIPGCDVPFDNCTIHHLWWWEHLGPTDLTNLRPTCSRHHHDLHEGGWKVQSDGWSAVITRPDGGQMHTGPPPAEAA